MQSESWKDQRQLQCHVRERFLKRAYGKNVVSKKGKAEASLKQRPDSVVLLKLYCILQFSAKIYSDAASNEDSRCKGSSGQGMEKA